MRNAIIKNKCSKHIAKCISNSFWSAFNMFTSLFFMMDVTNILEVTFKLHFLYVYIYFDVCICMYVYIYKYINS